MKDKVEITIHVCCPKCGWKWLENHELESKVKENKPNVKSSEEK